MISQQSNIYYTKASGKVLITGGYGVLQKNNIGLTLALQNSFYCKIQHWNNASKTSIEVSSAQINKKYHYSYDQTTNKLIQTQFQQNPFVQNALDYSLKYFNCLQNIGTIKIGLFFDQGFISQNNIKINHPKFPIYQNNYFKTGLGSSACVIVSIVSAICFVMKSGQNRNIINVISQVANLSAQKKIGSNFDISTAVFGTHLYKNILPQLAFKCLETKNFADLLSINPQISFITPINTLIKNGTSAYMIDISKGANTRVMVSSFLKNLKLQSQQIQRQFFAQSKKITQTLFNIFKDEPLTLEQLTNKLKKVNLAHRKLQQRFSKLTQTAVQPLELQQFLNELMQNKNVLYAICPGSGGFDALFILTLKYKTKQYYDTEIQSIIKNRKKQLGDDLKMSLKQVDINWTNDFSVNQMQKECINKFQESTFND